MVHCFSIHHTPCLEHSILAMERDISPPFNRVRNAHVHYPKSIIWPDLIKVVLSSFHEVNIFSYTHFFGGNVLCSQRKKKDGFTVCSSTSFTSPFSYGLHPGMVRTYSIFPPLYVYMYYTSSAGCLVTSWQRLLEEYPHRNTATCCFYTFIFGLIEQTKYNINDL